VKVEYLRKMGYKSLVDWK